MTDYFDNGKPIHLHYRSRLGFFVWELMGMRIRDIPHWRMKP